MTEAENAPVGLVIEGRYRVVHKIAEGGMATVYQAVDERLDRTVAIKIMHTQLAQGPHRDQFVERFRREAKSAAAIANPHIVQVYDTGEYQGLDFLVMEYVHGVNLRHEMNVQHTFSVRETLRIVSETLDGLSAAHRLGVVHRDIKPENILLNDRGHVQITDFGLAKAASQATLSSTGMLLGTAAYLAPEMIENNQATAQGDLYSVGITAWEMLAGEVPFRSDNPVTLVFKHVHEDVPSLLDVCPGIDPQIAQFIAHLTARAVDARPTDATEALRELRKISANLSIPAWQYRRQDDVNTTEGSEQSPTGIKTGLAAGTALAAEAVRQVQATPPAPPEHTADNTDDDSYTNGADSAEGTVLIDPLTTQVIPSAPSSGSTDTRIMPTADDTSDFTQVIGLQDSSDTDSAADSAFDSDSKSALDTQNGQTDSSKPRKKSKKPWIIAAIIILLLAAAGGGAAWWYYLGPGSYWTMPQPNDITCSEDETCPITNADWSDYESTLIVAGIPYTVNEEYSDTVDEGDIISTDPENVGDRVSKRSNDSVTITVSLGVEQATIPDDILDPTSENGQDPLTALADAGFDNVVHDSDNDEYSLTVPEGAALTISSDPGTTVDHNTEITVTLSLGPMPVSMPNVIGLSQSEAKSELEDLNLTVKVSESYSDSVSKGNVISASSDAGDELHWGDTVTIVVSLGPETAIIPSDLVGQQEEDVISELENLGFEVEVEYILGGLFGTVRDVQYDGTSVSDGATVRLRDTDGNPTVITLTVV